jgi:LPXTG-motif cell wall-anchored protein
MLDLVKEVVTPAGGTLGPEGGNVTYKVTISNLSSAESITIDSLTDDVDGNIYDLLNLTEHEDLVDNTCNDALPMTIAALGSESCTFTLFVDHTTVSAVENHENCEPSDKVTDVANAIGTGDSSDTTTNEADDCAEVEIEEPDASLAIDKLVKDPVTAAYVNDGIYPSSETFPSTAEWKITVSNPSDDKVINIVFTDPKAPACVTAFTAAMDAIHADKDWLDPAESVTFTCTDAVASIPFINTAIANGDDVWERAVDEVSDTATLGQIDASGSIGDTVWYDCAKTDTTDATCDNGVQDTGELGIEDTKVTITGLDGQDVDPGVAGVQTTKSLLTDANGKYLFVSLPDGNYRVQVLIGDVPDAEDRTLRFTTASTFTILLPEGGERLDADFGVIADTLPETGLNADQIMLVAMLLLGAGTLAIVISKRKENELGTEMAA